MPSLLRSPRTPPLRPRSVRPPSAQPVLVRPPSALAAVVVALTLAAVGAPTVAFASPRPSPPAAKMLAPEPEPSPSPRASVRVDTSALEPNTAEQMREKIVEAAHAAFAARRFAAAEHSLDPRIVIAVEPMGTEENPGFVIGYSIEQGDDVVSGSARQSECPLCTRTEVVERIEQDLGPLLALAAEHQRGDDSPIETSTGPGPVGPEIEGPAPDTRKIGPLGYAGIGLAVVGLAGVGTGVGLVAKGVEPIAADPSYQRNFRTPGFVALGVGGAALVAGIVVLALDLSQRKRGRAGSDARVRPHGLGVAF
jgi:F0F1-type ATP synthase membrane subunit c/vacuolar-type H+-ATPase subunit K